MLVFAFSSTSLYSQGFSEAKVKQEINNAAAKLMSLQCDFVQTKYLKMLNDKMISNGKMYYLQSNKLRWEYTSPYHYTFILNDNKVLLKNDNRNDVIDVQQNKLFKEIARIMMNSVVGKSLSDERDFKSKISSSGSEWIATLTPVRKEMKQMFKEIYLYFNKTSYMVSKVTLIEKNGDKTVIELKNVKTAAEDWKEIATDTFMFARYAKEDFDSDDWERKRTVIKTLGAHLRLSGRTIVFTPVKYLVPIAENRAELEAKKEAARTAPEQIKKDLREDLISVWCT
jgi:outer membrane lipoprotein carrier protein